MRFPAFFLYGEDGLPSMVSFVVRLGTTLWFPSVGSSLPMGISLCLLLCALTSAAPNFYHMGVLPRLTEAISWQAHSTLTLSYLFQSRGYFGLHLSYSLLFLSADFKHRRRVMVLFTEPLLKLPG